MSLFSGERLWLANGACVYIDGQLLEYATPECFTSVTGAAAEHAGRIIIGEACERAQTAIGKNLAAFARCSGPDGLEAGYHENYGLPPEQYFNLFNNTFWPRPVVLKSIVPHLVSRIVWSGKGERTQDGWHYSPRAAKIDRIWDWDTKTHRPVIHIKRPNMADDLLRVEITCGDFNSPTITTLKLGSTAAVLLAASQGAFKEARLTLSAPVEAMRSMAKSVTTPIRLHDGSSRSALWIQRAILSEIESVSSEIDRGGSRFNWNDTLEFWDKMLTLCEQGGDETLDYIHRRV
ncbi:proteasome accessory factor PafA2 family protein [Streptomyces collinus]|uniref:proteasome accessory factor PafA2 family protein n=1 Tax=Streptomyces collinus TaxID=42684 RepID=UPI003667F373